MGKHSARRVYVRFALGTAIAVVAVVAIAELLRSETLRSQAEQNAAIAVSGLLVPAFDGADGDLSDSDFPALSGLLSDRVRAIRVWDREGDLLASADVQGSASTSVSGMSEALRSDEVIIRKAGTPDGDLLLSYARLPSGMVLEVQQDYGPIVASLETGQLILLFVALGGSLALVSLLSLVHWATTRGLNSEYHRLLYLYRTGQAIRSTLDLTDVLERLARDVVVFTHGEIGLGVLVEEDTDLILKASFEREAESAARHHRKVEDWFLRRCAATGETVVAEQDHIVYTTFLGHEPAYQGPVHILVAPILGRAGTIGVLPVMRRKAQGTFTNQEVHVVEEMAAQAAMALEQAVLFAKMRTYASEVELSYDTTLKVLMAALDAKDAATEGHSERVAHLTVAVAKEMAVPKERLVDIERGALLHDVGKIGVPDAVLQKPEALNQGEWEAMQKHPLLAGLMVSKVEFLEGAMPILLYHHERYDGSGYPFGLEGDAIPLEARMFTVVDSYDAMTSDRPYRRAMRPDAALQEIEANAGVQFDPQVVEAFVRVMARMQPIARKRAS